AGGKSSDFKRAVSFFAQEVPRLSRTVAPLLRELSAQAYLSRPPSIGALCLSGLDPGDCIGNALVVDGKATAAAVKQWQRQHRYASAGIGASTFAVTTALLVWHGAQVDRAEDAVAAFGRTADNARWLGRERLRLVRSWTKSAMRPRDLPLSPRRRSSPS